MSVAKLRFLAQLCILLAIAACTALLMDSLGGVPAYCAEGAGCLAAQRAAREWLGPVPLPLVGGLAFWGLFVVTTLSHHRTFKRIELSAALGAATIGICLLLVQALVLRTFCPFCVVIDLSAVIVGAALTWAWVRARTHAGPAHYLGQRASLCLCLVAIVAPAAWPYFRPPSRVAGELAEFQLPNRVSIVEFVDLECSHCRALFPRLERLRQQYGDRLHFVRLHAPLRVHRIGRLGARLGACLEPDRLRVEQLNRILFELPELDQQSLVAAAEGVGLSVSEQEACWSDPASDAEIERNLSRLNALGFEGLPTTYVGGERIVGAMPFVVYLSAVERAQRSNGTVGLERVAFCVVFSILFLGLVWLGRRARTDDEQGSQSAD